MWPNSKLWFWFITLLLFILLFIGERIILEFVISCSSLLEFIGEEVYIFIWLLLRSFFEGCCMNVWMPLLSSKLVTPARIWDEFYPCCKFVDWVFSNNLLDLYADSASLRMKLSSFEIDFSSFFGWKCFRSLLAIYLLRNFDIFNFCSLW